MSTNNYPRKDLLEKLYISGKSMFEIAQALNCSVHKIAYWMDKYEIARRSPSDATYAKLNPNGDPFKIKENLTPSELYIKGLGLGIYWGEGDKRSISGIRVANTDSGVIKLFKEFLLIICQLEERKLRYYLICFNDSNIEHVKMFWAEELEINREKFGKIVQIPPQGKGTYTRKSEFGVCTIAVSNPKLKSWIMKEIADLKALP